MSKNENLYGKAVVYTDAKGDEYPATITGPATEVDKIKHTATVTERVHSITIPHTRESGNVAGADIEHREVRTVDLTVQYEGGRRADISGIQRQSNEVTRKCWRPA